MINKDKDLQIINDEIASYKCSICEIEDKLNLLKFLDSVDNTMAKSLNLDNQELMDKKTGYEKTLRKLINEKIKLLKNEEQLFDNSLEIKTKIINSLCLVNYMSFIYNFDNGFENFKKDSK